MPVAGLVLTVGDALEARARVVEALVSDPRIRVGAAEGAALPVVTDTQSVAEQQQLWDEIAALPDVLTMDLTYLDFSDVESFDVALGRLARSARPARSDRPQGEQ